MNSTTKILRALTALSGLAGAAGAAQGQCGLALSLLSASNKGTQDHLGGAVAMSPLASGGVSLMVGAPDHDQPGQAGAGAVYSFGRVNNVWGQLTMVSPSDPTAGDGFGGAVDSSDPHLIAGAPGSGSGGAVYIFSRAGSTWTQKLKWNDGAGNGGGVSVAIEEESGIAMAGSPYANVTSWGSPVTDGGAVRIFLKDGSGNWAYQGYLVMAAAAPGELHGGTTSALRSACRDTGSWRAHRASTSWSRA
jgi:hypothetical protein